MVDTERVLFVVLGEMKYMGWDKIDCNIRYLFTFKAHESGIRSVI